MRRLLSLLLCLLLCFALAPEVPPRSDAPPAPTPRPARKSAADRAPLPSSAALARLARTDPITFLRACIRRCDREVTGYTATLDMHERVNDRLKPAEVIDAAFREKPFSVLMRWRKGADRVQALLYERGANEDRILGKPAGWRAIVGIVAREPGSADVRAASRYPPTEFGIKVGMERVLESWVAAQKRGELKIVDLGQRRVKEVDNRLCWVLKRPSYARPEEDGITAATFYFDKATWMMLGSVLHGEGGKLIGSYYFRNLELNPKFAPDTFTLAALKR
jgi:hypothetical protein